MENRPSHYSFGSASLLPKEEMLETGRKEKKLVIGIPKETSKFENRIALTPQGVELLIQNGHAVLLESGAGEGANFSDHDFSESGATIVNNKKDVFESDIILKISPLTLEETDWLKPDQLIISLLYLYNQSKEKLTKMFNKKVNAIAFEFLQDENNCYPVIRSMSVILGAGTAGEFAARAAIGLGAVVKVFDNSYRSLRELELNLGQRVFTSVLHPRTLTKALKSADVVLGSLRYLQTGHSFMVTENQVAQMKKGSIIIDLSMDEGGCFESSICTDLEHPVFVKHDVIHYCVPNVASRVSRTASIALSNIFAPIMLQIAEAGGVHQLIKDNYGISQGIYIYRGILTNNHIGKKFNIPSKDLGLLMAAF